MAFRTQKISQMTPKGADLEATDLIEVSTIESGSYVTRSITGQEIIDAIPLPPTGITIGSTAIASGTVGRILFEGAGNVVQQSGNLFWDNAANQFIIGGSTASNVRANTNEFNIQRDGLTVPTNGNQLMFNLVGNGQGMSITNQNGTTYRIGQFSVSNVLTLGAAGNNTLNLFTSGNVGIGTTTDAGFRLDVNGTARVQGSATIQTLTVGLGAGSQSNNTVLGLSAFSSNTSGNFNVAIGPAALFNNTTGTGNIGVGHFAAVNIATGSNNVAIGREALSGNNSSGNVVIGMQACNTITGNNNVVLGLQAQAGNFSNSIVIGNSAIGAGNNSVVLGNDSITTTVLKGNVGIGTSTPAYALEVKKSVVGDHGTNIQNTSNSTSARSFFQVSNDTNQYAEFLLNSSTYTGSTRFGITGQAAFMDANVTTILGTIGTNALIFGTNNIERVRVFGSTGNVAINTTTDAGYKLDVNGTARVQGPSGYSMTYDANGIFNLYGTYSRLDLFNSAGSLRARLNNDGPNGTLTLYQNATSYIFLNGAQSGNNSYIATALSIGNQSAANASSILELTSTTKGFLPPRMTNAQMVAIATPAAGLQVYDTTNNKMCVYDGTTWQNLY